MSDDSGADGGEDTRPAAGQGARSATAGSRNGRPIATKEIDTSGATLRIDITALRRTGQLSTLSWDITVKENHEDSPWNADKVMGGRWGSGDYTVSNVTLIDPVNSKRYRVAYTPGEDGTCVCSETKVTDVELDEEETASLNATFAAPPRDVRTVNVRLGDLGELTDVPVS